MQQQGLGIYPTCPPEEEQPAAQGHPQQPGFPMQQMYSSPAYQGYPSQPFQQQQYAPGQPYSGGSGPGGPITGAQGPGAPGPGGPGSAHQSVVYQRAQSRVWPRYRHKSSLLIGWIQIAIGCLCVAFNAIGLCMQKYRDYEEINATFMVGAGFWGSIFFFLSGGFAIGAAKHKTTSMIVANMVFSILSVIFALAVLSSGASAIGVEKSNVLRWGHEASFKLHETARTDTRQHRASVAMGMLLVGLALLEFVCCIWSSIICCSAVCCGQVSATPMSMAQTQVIFMNNPQDGQTGQFVAGTGQTGQNMPTAPMVLVTNPGVYNQAPQGYMAYPNTRDVPPSYDSTIGSIVEKQ